MNSCTDIQIYTKTSTHQLYTKLMWITNCGILNTQRCFRDENKLILIAERQFRDTHAEVARGSEARYTFTSHMHHEKKPNKERRAQSPRWTLKLFDILSIKFLCTIFKSYGFCLRYSHAFGIYLYTGFFFAVSLSLSVRKQFFYSQPHIDTDIFIPSCVIYAAIPFIFLSFTLPPFLFIVFFPSAVGVYMFAFHIHTTFARKKVFIMNIRKKNRTPSPYIMPSKFFSFQYIAYFYWNAGENTFSDRLSITNDPQSKYFNNKNNQSNFLIMMLCYVTTCQLALCFKSI